MKIAKKKKLKIEYKISEYPTTYMMIEVTMDSNLEFLGTAISNAWKTSVHKKGLYFLHTEIEMGIFFMAELLNL